MKAPTHCPTCKDPLLNDFISTKNGSFLSYKECSNKLDHKFKCEVTGDGKELMTLIISLSIEPWQQVIWNFTDKKILVTKSKIKDVLLNAITALKPETIPWFEPNLKDMNHLVEKVKTYLIFL